MFEAAQHLFRVAALFQLRQGPLQLLVGQLGALAPVVTQHPHGPLFAAAAVVAANRLVDQGAGLLGGFLAGAHVFLDRLLEVIHGVQIDVVQFADFRLDVAGHGDIHHEHRPVAAALERPLHGALAQHRQRRGGAGNQNIRVFQRHRQLFQADAAPAHLGGQLVGARLGAVGDHDFMHLLLFQVPGHQLDHFAGADQQGAALLQVGEDMPGERHRRVGHRHRVGADAGFRADALGHREHVLEHPAQLAVDQPRLVGAGVGLAQLAENLRFAEHHGIQAAGHPHQVLQGFFVPVGIKDPPQGLHRHAPGLRQPLPEIRRFAVDQAVHFGTVAGGQQRRFADTGKLAQGNQGVIRLSGGKCQLLAQLHIRGGVINADCDEIHKK